MRIFLLLFQWKQSEADETKWSKFLEAPIASALRSSLLRCSAASRPKIASALRASCFKLFSKQSEACFGSILPSPGQTILNTILSHQSNIIFDSESFFNLRPNQDIMSLMELIAGNNVINTVVPVRNIVALLDIAALVQDIMLMAIVRLKWKKLLGTQFMLAKRIIFVLLENQKRHAPIGILNIILIVLEMILVAPFQRQMDLTNVRIYVCKINQNVSILPLTRKGSKLVIGS